ncbi:MAG TPA: S41 family peptidase [Gemmatimonadaceae bacterium]|nr:S41 family peptidase [Gemmatimonadaceae bacterium]
MSVSRVRVAFAAGVLTAALGVGGWVLGSGFRVEQRTGAGAKLFDQVLSAVAERYVDSLDASLLYQRAAAGLVYELGDPHSVFLDSARLVRVQSSITGLVGQLGVTVDVRDGWVSVLSTLPGAPADVSGLRAGDRIVSIDGRATRDWTTEEARRALRGNPGSTVTVIVERVGVPGRTELTLEREAVYQRPVQRAMLIEPRVGYLALRTFSDSAALELTSAIDSLHAAGMRALVFDLRGNPGGLLNQGTAIADLFLDSGQAIVSLRGRDPESNRSVVATTQQRWPDLRLAVLVDRSTASASEIVAGALQDHDRALVLGRRTYGKGSAQAVFSFRDAAGLKLTTSRWYTPSGRNIDFSFEAALDGDGTPADTAKKVYKTALGRTVAGGGGIVPDVVAGDSITPPEYRALFAAVGRNMRRFRASQSEEARAIARRSPPSPDFDVTPAMRDALYLRATRAGVRIDRAVFDRAATWIDRQLGAEATRIAFGRVAEERRLVTRDRTVQEAVTRLKAARTTRDLFAKAN